jgi:hypothetical protein
MLSRGVAESFGCAGISFLASSTHLLTRYYWGWTFVSPVSTTVILSNGQAAAESGIYLTR